MLNDVFPNTILLVQPFIKNLLRNHVLFKSFLVSFFKFIQMIWRYPLQIRLCILKNIFPRHLFCHRLRDRCIPILLKVVSVIRLKLWCVDHECWILVDSCFWLQIVVLILLNRLIFDDRICDFRRLLWYNWIWSGRISKYLLPDRLKSTPRRLIFGSR